MPLMLMRLVRRCRSCHCSRLVNSFFRMRANAILMVILARSNSMARSDEEIDAVKRVLCAPLSESLKLRRFVTLKS